MEHKTFIFDTNTFNQELREIIISSGRWDDTKSLKKFIKEHISKLYSPYTGELLDEDWEGELENEDVQEYSDFCLTYYYSPEEEYGLAYLWDALIEVLSKLQLSFEAEYCILGAAVETDDFILDPGGEGMGFVEAEDVPKIYGELINKKEEFEKTVIGNSLSEKTLFEVNYDELVEAYTELISIYKEASSRKLGLMITF